MFKASRVALVKGESRYHNILKALELVQGELPLKGARRVLIKPNFTSVTRPLAATHVEAVKALLDFLRGRTAASLVIAEGSGTPAEAAGVGFRSFGYLDLLRDYPVRFLDLNRDATVPVTLLDWRWRPFTVRLARTVVDSDFRISICPPKTHDQVMVTASVKNLAMGSVVRRTPLWLTRLMALGKRLMMRNGSSNLSVSGSKAFWLGRLTLNDKVKVHQGYAALNVNLCRLARLTLPHLAVIDGFRGMEGLGPVDGDEVALGVALASPDPVAADSVAARLMGFDPSQIGYLAYCQRAGLGVSDLARIELLGERLENCLRPFQPYPTYQAQLEWAVAGVERFIGEAR